MFPVPSITPRIVLERALVVQEPPPGTERLVFCKESRTEADQSARSFRHEGLTDHGENLKGSGKAANMVLGQSCEGPSGGTEGPPQMHDHAAQDPQDPGTKDPKQKKVGSELTCQLVSPGRPVICMRWGVRLGWGWVRSGTGKSR